MFRLLIRIVDFPLSRLTDLGVWGMGYGVWGKSRIGGRLHPTKAESLQPRPVRADCDTDLFFSVIHSVRLARVADGDGMDRHTVVHCLRFVYCKAATATAGWGVAR